MCGEKINIYLYRKVRLSAVISFSLLLLGGSAEANSVRSPLPIGVQAVLQKIGTYMADKQYAQAAEALIAYSARGKTPFNAEVDDPRGYHHPEVYFALGNCYLLQAQYDQAGAAYEKSLARDPDHVGAWLNLAKVRYEQKNLLAAAHCFEHGYAADPAKNPENLNFAACAYLMAEKYAQAIDTFRRLISAHPKAMRPSWQENYIHALLAAEMPLVALPLIEELTRIYSGDKRTRWQEILLSQYLSLGQQEKALAFVKKLTHEAPTLARWWKATAHVQLNLGRNKEALCALMIYSYLTPLNREEQKLLADLNLQAGIPFKASPLYENVLAQSPDKKILQQLLMAYQQQGKPETALRTLEKYDQGTDDPNLLMIKGDLLYALGSFQQAAKIYRRAAQADAAKNRGRAWLMAGYAAWQAADLDQSRKAFLLAANDPTLASTARGALAQIK